MSHAEASGAQLSPETILHAVAEAEDKLWGQRGITELKQEHLQQTTAELGTAILQHGAATRMTHGYFTNLEQRKCCLLLAACKHTFDCVRLVRNDGRDSGIEEGAMMKSAVGLTDTVLGLDAVEFRVYQHAFICAAFPVLGAPEPPTGITPSPASIAVATGTSKRRGYQGTLHRINSHDSGVEDQSDTSMVPSETLCELLRRAFRLSPEKFSQYEEIISSKLEKKSPQKILAEELVRQLIALENNANVFYNPKTFLNRLGYDQWQQRERAHITELIQKFWHYSLPNPTQSATSRQISTVQAHSEYVLLLEKLIRYESPYRQESELISPPPTSPLSSASVRLLLEFSLRYGVGEQFRKIVYLYYLAMNFDPTVWFIQHVTSSLAAVMDLLPSKRSYLVIVTEEYSKLETSLQLLEAKASAAIVKMKTLFPSNKPAEGIESLIELLSLTLQVKSYLIMQPEESLGIKLHKLVQTMFPTAYERHKMVAKDELRQNKWTVELNPKLLNMIIGKIRDEVQDYRQNYQMTFSKYFNITMEAAQEFYLLLMADVAELQKQAQENLTSMEIDLLQLSLAYRLNQLDTDWTRYITPQMQTWRDCFLQEFLHWAIVIKVHMQDIVTEVVSLDKYTSSELQWTGSLLTSSSSGIGPRVSGSLGSLTPSVNSAFSSFSSPDSTPVVGAQISHHQPVIKESSPEEAPTPSPRPRAHIFTPVQERLSLSTQSHSTDKRASSDPITISSSSLLNGSYLAETARSLGHCDDSSFLSFAHLRHSSSLPNILPAQCDVRYVELESRRAVTDTKKKLTPIRSLTTSEGHVTPEIHELLSKDSDENFDDVSDHSQTLTEESDSEEEQDFKFPPLQEVRVITSSPPSHVDTNPVNVYSENIVSTTVVRPTAVSAKAGLPSSSSVPQSKDGSQSYRQNLQTKVSDIKNLPKTGEDHRNKTNVANKKQMSIPIQQQIGPVDSQQEPAQSHSGSVHNLTESLTDSLISSVSFPQPSGPSITTVPVSSSTIDVIVVLQRIVGISKTLCRTLSPYQNRYDSEQSTVLSSDEEMMHKPPINLSCRQKLYDAFLNCICNTICTYCDNMLCMDLCGTTTSTAKRLAGPRLIEYLRTQQDSGMIWGCRHNVTGVKNCFEYINKRTELLCDRHEPVTREMCVRINNVMAMLTFIETYHRRLGRVFSICTDWSVKPRHSSFQMSVNSTEFIRSEFIMVDDYSYDPRVDRADVLETTSQRCPSSSGASQSSAHGAILVSSPIDTHKNHLMAILRAQCRIMAYRLNLFVQDALPVLLTLTRPGSRVDIGLRPVTDFLRSYITALQGWLYKDSLRRVLECLWIFIVQDFEMELKKLEDSNNDESRSAGLLLQALSHFLKFMNSQHESLKKELLLSEADGVCFKLSLYSSPTSQLIAVFTGLLKDSIQMERTSVDSQYQTVMIVRQRIQQDLQTFRKCFSGTDLVRWIMENQELFVNFDPYLSESGMAFTRETAGQVAQRLLEWGLVADVEKITARGCKSRADSIDSLVNFPDLTIISQLPSVGNSRNRAGSVDSDDSIQVVTPRATPRPTIKASIRAASRHSAFKWSTHSRTAPPTLVADGGFLSSQNSTSNADRICSTYKPVEDTVASKDSGVYSGEGMTCSNRTEVKVSVHSTQVPGTPDSLTSSSVSQLLQKEDNQLVDSGINAVMTARCKQPTGSHMLGNESIDSGHAVSGELSQDSFRDFDPYQRVTPLSIRSAMSSSVTSVRFIETSEVFYYICPLAASEKEVHVDFELLKLVEECFQRKVSPDYIFKIVYSRRKYDLSAKNFIKTYPELMENMKQEIGHGVCVSS